MEDVELWVGGDPSWPFAGYINKYNKTMVDKVSMSLINVLDEAMSAFHPCALAKGGLPNISFLIQTY